MEHSEQNLQDSDYLIIPNPIYDVVFRYLMEDIESATIVISTLLNEKIKKLQFLPIDHAEKKENKSSTVVQDPKTQDDVYMFHLDFAATIELPDGSEELIMIELQKASEPNDIFRFKRYISKNFQQKKEVEFTDPKTQAIETVNKPIRLIPIFILNFRIENEINDLLIRTNRIKTGVFKNQNLQKHNEFIDNLSYDIWVVQLPNIQNIGDDDIQNDEYKQKLYALLKLFDQKSRLSDNEHRIRVLRKYSPAFLERVVRRIQAASINNHNLEEQMFAEDEYLKTLIKRDNKINLLEEIIDKKDKELEEKEKALEENTKALEEKDEVLKAQNKIILELAKTLKTNGISTEQILNLTGLASDIIEKL